MNEFQIKLDDNLIEAPITIKYTYYPGSAAPYTQNPSSNAWSEPDSPEELDYTVTLGDVDITESVNDKEIVAVIMEDYYHGYN